MSYQVLARKWRPQTFADVVGQEHVTATLANAIAAGRVAHAYIFSGARGVGKTTTARILAKALNCKDGPTPTPCGVCPACIEIAAGTSLDVIEIDAASNRGIDQVRELRDMVRYAPVGGRSKVVILDEAHQLTDEAANALLKTLEEPPPGVVFVLATTKPEDLVDTIRSRAQHFHFRALSFAEIDDAVQRIAADEKLAIQPGARAVIARAAEGSLRDSLSILEQAIAYCGETITDRQVRELLGVVAEETLGELLDAIRERSAERALALVGRLVAEGQNVEHFCREAIRHFRNLLVARVAGAESELIAAPAEERAALAAAAAGFSEEDLTRYFHILMATHDDIRRKPDPRLHLELGLLRLVNAARLAPLEEVLAELSGEGNARPGRPATASAAPAEKPPRASAGPAPRAEAAAAGASTVAAPARAEVSPVRNDAPAPRGELLAPSAPARATPSASAGTPVAAPPPSVVARTAAAFDGIEAAQVEAIKQAVLAQQKFLGSLVDQVTRWELDGGEMRLYFPSESRALAELLGSRDPMERLRTISSRLLGQPVRICVKLESAPPPGGFVREPGRAAAELRARFEEDPIVRAMLERFGGRISDVRRREED
jgi:DNA polymerase-3 subunit gamma/tau